MPTSNTCGVIPRDVTVTPSVLIAVGKMKLFWSTNGERGSNDERESLHEGRFHGFRLFAPTAPSKSESDTSSVRFSFAFQNEYTSQFSLCKKSKKYMSVS